MDVFAAQARLLTDEELDGVHAEGLFFEFDVSFGDITDLVNNSFAMNSFLKDKGIVQASNKDIKVLKDINPLAEQMENIKNLSPQDIVSQNSSNNIQTASISDTTAISQDDPFATSELVNNDNNIMPVSVQSIDNPGSDLSVSQPTVTNDTPLQINLFAGNDENGNVNLTPMQENYYAGEDTGSGDFDMPELPESNSGITVSPAGNGSYNVVIVDDLAQQNLSSMVNVNAAGSVVPVLINITININSTVESISNQNSLDLSNYYKFNLK